MARSLPRLTVRPRSSVASRWATAALACQRLESREVPAAVRAGFAASNIGRQDDAPSVLANLGFSINYFGTTYTNTYVNNNGNITFGAALSTFNATALSGAGLRIIAPLWSDVDTQPTASGITSYGTSTVFGHAAFGATWPGVGRYSLKTDKLNTYQAIVIDRSDTGAGNFDFELNYDKVQWDTADGSTAGRAGYSNGSTVNFELAGSGTAGAMLDSGPAATKLTGNKLNSDTAGQYYFRVRGGAVFNRVFDASGGANRAVTEGTDVPLTGTTSAEPGITPAQYDWDFDYDGVTFTTDATGTTATVPGSSLNGPLTRTVAYRVRGSSNYQASLTEISSFVLTVNNATPTVNAGGTASLAYAGTLGRTATFADPGSAAGETYTATVNYGDGGGVQSLGAVTQAAGVSLSHQYTTYGAYTVTVTVTDSNNAVGTSTFAVNVANPTVVYVNDTFSNPTNGQDPDGSGPATKFGPNGDAYSTLTAAIAAVQSGGTVVLYGGSYAESPAVSKPLTITEVADGGVAAAALNGLSSTAGTTVTVSGKFGAITNANYSFAGPVALGGDTTVGAGNGTVSFGVAVNGAFALNVTVGTGVGSGSDFGGTAALASLTWAAGTLTLTGTAKVAGPVSLTAAGGVTVGAITTTAGGSLSVNADSDANGTGTYTQTGAAGLGGGFVVTAADVDLQAALAAGVGHGSFVPSTATAVVRVGSGAGGFSLTDAELDRVSTTTGYGLYVGSSTQTAGLLLAQAEPISTGLNFVQFSTGGSIDVGTFDVTGAAGGTTRAPYVILEADSDANGTGAITTGTGRVRANDLYARAAQGIALVTDVNSLSELTNRTSGAIAVSELDAVTVGGVGISNVAAGSVTVTAGGNVSVSAGVGGGPVVRLASTNGTVNTTATITGTGLVDLLATGGVTVGAGVTAGTAYTVNADTDANAVGTYAQSGAVTVTGGAFAVTAADVDLTGTLKAAGGAGAFAPSTTGTVVKVGSGPGGFSLADAELDLVTLGAAYTLTVGAAASTAGLQLAQTEVVSTGLNVRYQSGGAISVGANDLTGAAGGATQAPYVALAAGGTGAITNAGGRVRAAALVASAVQGISLLTDATTLSGVSNTGSGAISIGELDAVTVGGTGITNVATGNVSVTAAGNITVTAGVSGGPTVRLSSTTGTLTTSGTGTVAAAGLVNLLATGGVTVGATVTAGNGYTVSADANGTGAYSQTAAVAVTGGSVAVTATDVNIAAALSVAAGNVALAPSTAAATVRVSSAGSGFSVDDAEIDRVALGSDYTLTIGSTTHTGTYQVAQSAAITTGLNLRFQTGGSIAMGSSSIVGASGGTSRAPSVVFSADADSNGTGAVTNAGGRVRADTVAALAAQGISLLTEAGTLTRLTNSTSGDITIDELDAVTIGVFGVSNVATGTVSITAGGTLTVSADVGGGPLVRLTSTAGAVSATGAITGTGAVDLLATAGVSVGGGITAGGAFTANADTDADGAGTFAQSAGTITAGDTATITGGDVSITGGAIKVIGNIKWTPSKVTLAVELGTGGGTVFGLSDAELDRVTAAAIEIGQTGGGSIGLTQDITPVGSGTLRLISGYDLKAGKKRVEVSNLRVTVGGAAELDGANDVDTLSISAGGAVTFLDTDGATVGTVGGQSGVVAGGAAYLDLDSDNDGIGDYVQAAVPVSGTTVTVAAADVSITLGSGGGAGGSITATAKMHFVVRAGRAVDLGTNTAGKFSLTDGELDAVTTPLLEVGDTAGTGAISVTADVGPANAPTFALRTAYDLKQAKGARVFATTFTADALGSIVLTEANDASSIAMTTSGGPISYSDANSVTVTNLYAGGGAASIAAVSGITVTGLVSPSQATDRVTTLTADSDGDGVGTLTQTGGTVYGVTINLSGADYVVTGGNTDAGPNGRVTLTATTGRAVELGTGGTAFGVSDAELDRIGAGVIAISSGAGITATEDISPLYATVLRLSTPTPTYDLKTSKKLAVAGLVVDVSGDAELTGANAVTTFASRTGGKLLFNDADGVTVGTVDGTSGIAAGGIVVLDNDLGGYVQEAVPVGGTVVTIRSADVSLAAGGTISASTGRVTFAPSAGVTQVLLGAAPPAGTPAYSLTDAELDAVTAGVVQIGSATGGGSGTISLGDVSRGSGTIKVKGNWDLATLKGGRLAAPGLAIDVTGGVVLDGDNTVGAFAASAIKSITYVNHDDLPITTVDGVSGVTAGGTVTLVADGNGDGIGAYVQDAVAVSGTAVTIVAADVQLTTGTPGGTISAGTGRVTLRPSTTATAIVLGGTAAGAFSLTDAELDTITAGVLDIGSLTGASISVAGPIDPANVPTLHLRTGYDLKTQKGARVAVANLAVEAGGDADLGTGNDVDVVAIRAGGAVTFGDADGFTIGTVDGVTGITAGGALTLAGDDGFTVSSDITAAGALVLNADADNDGIGDYVQTAGTVSGTSVTIIANDVALSGGAIAAGTGRATFQASPPTRDIELGDASGAPALVITDAELDRVTAAVIDVRTATGNVTVTSPIDPAAAPTLRVSGYDLKMAKKVVADALVLDAGGAVTGGDASDINSFAAKAAGGVTFSDIDGFTVGTVDGTSGVTAGGAVALDLDSDNDGLGDYVQAAVAVSGTSVSITAADVIDTLGSGGTTAGGTIAAGTGRVTFKATAGRAIDLGTNTAGKFGLTDGELDAVTAGVLEVGQAAGGGITITGNVDPANAATLHLKSGYDLATLKKARVAAQTLVVTVGGGVTLDGPNDVDTLAVTAGGAVAVLDTDGFTVGTSDGVSGVVAGGAVSLNADSDGDDLGDYVQAAVPVSGSNVTIAAADVSITTGGSGSAGGKVKAGTGAGAGKVTFNPFSFTRTIDLGTNTPGRFSLTDAELDCVTASTIAVGRAGGGDVTVTAPIDFASPVTFRVSGYDLKMAKKVTADALVLDAGGSITGGDASDVNTFAARAAGGIAFGDANGFTVGPAVDGTSGVVAGTAVALNADDDGDGVGTYTQAAGTVSGTAVEIAAADVALNAGTVSAGTGRVTFKHIPKALLPHRSVVLGAGDGTTLAISDAELDRVTAGTITLGSADAGDITVAEPISPANAAVLTLRTGYDLKMNKGARVSVAALAVAAGGAIDLGSDNGVSTVALAAGGGLAIGVTGSLTVDTVDGLVGITAGGAARVNKVESITIKQKVSAVGEFAVTADADGDGVGSFTLASAVTVTASKLTVQSGDIIIDGNSRVNVGNGRAAFLPSTPALAIDLGTNTAGKFGLTDSELDAVTAGVLEVGRADGAGITITDDITPANAATLHVKSGYDLATLKKARVAAQTLVVTVGGGVTLDGPNDVDTLAVAAGGAVTVLDTDGFTVGTADGVSGVVAGGTVSLDLDSDNDGIGDYVQVAVPVSGSSVTIRAADVSLAAGGTVSAGTGRVLFAPSTGVTQVLLGASPPAGTAAFSLSDAELDAVTAATVQIGTATGGGSGTITVGGDFSRSAGVLALKGGWDVATNKKARVAAPALVIDVTGGVTLDGNNDIGTLAVRSGGSCVLVCANGFTVGTVDGVVGVTSGGAISFDADGDADGTGTYTQTAAVTGTTFSVVASDVSLVGSLTATGSSAGTGRATFKASTAGRAVELGTGGGTVFGLSDAELDCITAGVVEIASGAGITAAEDISPLNVPTLRLSTPTPTYDLKLLKKLTVAGLVVDVSGDAELTGDNEVGTFAAVAGGRITMKGLRGVTVGTVDGTSGVVAGGEVVFDLDSDNDGIGTYTQAAVKLTASKFTVTGGDIILNDNSRIGVGSGYATFKPSVPTAQIDLGTNTAGKFSLTDAELDTITSGVIAVGRVGGGDVTVTAPIDFGTPVTFRVSGYDLKMAKKITADALVLDAGGSVTSGDASDVSTLAGRAGGGFAFRDANGFTVGTVDGTSGIAAGGIVVLQNDLGDYVQTAVAVSGTAVTIRAADVSLASGGTINAGTGRVLFAPTSGVTQVVLGASPPAGTTAFSLSDAELDAVTAATVQIGTATGGGSGTITVGGDFSLASGVLALKGGWDVKTNKTARLAAPGMSVDVTGGVTLDGANDFTTVAVKAGAACVIACNDGVTVGSVDGVSGIVAGGAVALDLDADNDGIGDYVQEAVAVGGTAVTVRAADVSIALGNSAGTPGGTINAGTGRVTLAPTAGTQLVVLGGTAAGAFSLTDAELDAITAGVLDIGSLTGASISVAGPIDPANVPTLHLRTGYDLKTQKGARVAVANLAVEAGGDADLGTGNDVDVVAIRAGGAVTFGDADGFTIGTVDGVTGITAGGALTLAGDDGFTVSSDITAAGALVLNADADNDGVGDYVQTAGTVSGTAVTIIANDVTLSGGGVTAGTGRATFQASPPTRNIILGNPTGAAALVITDAELDRVTASIIDVQTALGDVTFSDTVDPANAATLRVSGYDLKKATKCRVGVSNLVLVAGGLVDLGTDNLVGTLAITAGGAVTFGDRDGFTVGTVDGVAGVSSGGAISFDADSDQDGIGAYTQSAAVSGATFKVVASDVSLVGTLLVTGTADGRAVFQTSTPTRDVELGTGTTTFALSDAELDRITASIVDVTTASGNISITEDISVTGAATIKFSGFDLKPCKKISADALVVTAGGEVDLGDANDVNSLAIRAVGKVTFRDVDGFTVGTVDGISGVVSTNGVVSLDADSDGDGLGDYVQTAGVVSGTGVTVVADDVVITGGSLSAGTGRVTVKPSLASRAIELGGQSAGTPFGLSTAELARVTAGVLEIGRADGGGITVTGDTDVPGATTLRLKGGYDLATLKKARVAAQNLVITVGGGVTLDGPNDVTTLAVTAGGSVVFADANDLIVGTADGVSGITSTAGGVTTTANGDISVTQTVSAALDYVAACDADGFNDGRYVLSAGVPVRNVTIIASDIDIQQGGSISVGTGRAIFKASTLTRAIVLGAGDGTQLALSDAELDRVTAGHVEIGQTGGGGVTVTELISFPFSKIDYQIKGKDARALPGGGIRGGGLAVAVAGAVDLGAINDVTTLAISAGGAVTFGDLNGFTVGTVDGVTGVTAGGAISFDADSDADGTGVYTQTAAVSGTAFTVVASDVSLVGSLTVGGSTGVGGRATFKTSTAGRAVELGTGTTTFALSDAELDRITAGVIAVVAAGDITATEDISPAHAPVLSLTGDGLKYDVKANKKMIVSELRVSAGGGITLTGDNDVDAFAATAGGDIAFRDTDGFTVRAVDGLTGVVSTGGAVSLDADCDGDGLGDYAQTAGAVSGTSVTVVADDAVITGGTVSAGTGRVTFKQSTAARTVELGGQSNGTPFGLSDAELDRVTAGVLEIGRADGGSITITGDTDPSGATTLRLKGGYDLATLKKARVAAQNLVITVGGGVTLDGPNDVGTLAVTAGGSVVFADSASFAVGTADGVSGVTSSTGAVSLSANGDIMVTQNVSAALTYVGTCDADANGVGRFVQTGGTISGTAATVVAADVDMTGGAIAVGPGRATFKQSVATRAIELGTGGGTVFGLSDAELDRITAGVIDIGQATGGGITITQDIDPANSPTLVLRSGYDLATLKKARVASQNLAVTVGGAVTLDGSNAVSTLAIKAGGAVTYADVDGFEIGTVDGVAGLKAGGVAALEYAGDLTQTQPITAPSLRALGKAINAKPYVLWNNVANDVDTLAISGQGDVTFADANALTVGTVAGLSGVSVSSGYTITLTAGGPLTLAAGLTAPGGAVDLKAAGVSQTGGTVQASKLRAYGAGKFALELDGNSVATLAGDVTGAFSYFTKGGVDVGSVTANGTTTNGLRTGGGTLDLRVGTDLTQTQPIVAGATRYSATTGAVILENVGNDVTTVAAAAGTTVSLTDVGGVTIGTAGGLTGITAGRLVAIKTIGWNATVVAPVTAPSVSLTDGSYTLAAADRISDTEVTLTDATLKLAGFNETVGSLAGNAASEVNVGTTTATFTAGGNNLSTAFAGKLTGTGTVVKAGSGTLTLSGVSPVSGAVSVTGGGLLLTGSLTGTGTVTLTGTGTRLTGGGTGSITNRGVVVNGTAAVVADLAQISNPAAYGAGVLVTAGKSASILNVVSTGNFLGIDVNGGTALIQGSTLSSNTKAGSDGVSAAAGLRARNGAVVDAGQLSGSPYGNFTGLGTSAGGNNFVGYSWTAATYGGAALPTVPRAILDLNTGGTYSGAGAQLGTADLLAQGNNFGSVSTLNDVERLIYHDLDNSALGFVNYGAAGKQVSVSDPFGDGSTVRLYAVQPGAAPFAGTVSDGTAYSTATTGQKSLFRYVQVTFDGLAYLVSGPNAAFSLVKTSGPGTLGGVGFQLATAYYDEAGSNNANRYTLTYSFTDASGSDLLDRLSRNALSDGNYTFSFNSAAIQSVGPGGAAAPQAASVRFWRAFGDVATYTTPGGATTPNGGRAVNNADRAIMYPAVQARARKGVSSLYRADLDFNNDSYIDTSDYNEFTRRYGTRLETTGAFVVLTNANSET